MSRTSWASSSQGWPPTTLQAIEDGQALPISGLQQLRPGAQIVVALNPGPTFALRNSQGATRGSLIQRTLQDWANSRSGSNLDDLSLLITNGSETTHLSDPGQWAAALKSWKKSILARLFQAWIYWGGLSISPQIRRRALE